MPGPSFAPFRIRVFALFWIGSFVSNIGTIMEAVALGIYVQQRTGQAAWNGAVAALGFVPTAVVGPLGGVLADRLSRRRILFVSTSLSLLLAGAMTALVGTDHGHPLAIAAVSFLAGSASAVAWPAFQSMLPDLVPADDLVAAVGLSTAQWNLARVVGPALAALVVAAAGVTTALAINTASFLAVIAVLFVVRLPPPSRATDGLSVSEATRRAWRFARADPGLRATTTLLTINAFCAAAYIGLIPAVARKVHHGGAALTGALATAMGVGAVAAALSLGALAGRFGVRRVLLTATCALPPATLLYAVAPSPAAAMAALALLAFAYMSALSSVSSLTQLRAPVELRGRLVAVNMLVLGLAYPAALAIQGKLGDAIGLRWAMAAFAALNVVLLAVVRLRNPALAASLDAPTPPAPAEPAAAPAPA